MTAKLHTIAILFVLLAFPAMAQYSPFRNSRLTEVDGLQFHYRHWQAEGEAVRGHVLLLHGFGGSTFSWEGVADSLQILGYEVVAVDMPPFGYSDKSPRINQSVTARAERLHRFLSRDFPGETWHLAGHSMGGAVAQAFAILHPSTLESVTFVAGALFDRLPRGEPSLSPILRLSPFRFIAGELAEEWILTEGRIERMLASAYGLKPEPCQVRAYLEPLLIPGTARAILSAAAYHNELHRLDASDLTVPSLAIWGDSDSWVPHKGRRSILDRTPQTELVLLEGVGHNPMETHLDEFMAAWLNFLEGREEQSGQGEQDAADHKHQDNDDLAHPVAADHKGHDTAEHVHHEPGEHFHREGEEHVHQDGGEHVHQDAADHTHQDGEGLIRHDGGEHIHSHGHGQAVHDTVYWYGEEALFRLLYHEKELIDTSLTDFHRYAYHQDGGSLFAGQGNTGRPLWPLLFSPGEYQGFRLHSHNHFPGYLLSLDEVRYHRPDHVFSELYYVLGSQNEQLFHARHNQRFHERIYGGFTYQTVNSPGLYSRQATRHANFLAYVDAEPLEDYQVAGSFLINRLVVQESGGLVDPAGFEEDDARDEVFLYQAVSRRREIGFRIQQAYQPSWQRGRDTIAGSEPAGLGQIRHSFTYMRQAFVFDESNAPSQRFYPGEPRFNEVQTYDSSQVHTMRNHLGWSTHLPSGRHADYPMHLHFYVLHELIGIRQPLLHASPGDEYPFFRSRFAQLSPGAELASNPSALFSFDAHARYTFGGYNANDHRFGGGLWLGRPADPLRLRLEASWQEQEAAFFHYRSRSNYVSWHEDLSKTRILRATSRLDHGIFSLEGNYYQIHRPVFLGLDAFPVQPDEWLGVLRAGLSVRVEAGPLRMRHRLWYQYVGEDHFERFPAWLSDHSVHASFWLFNKALYAQTGFDLRYNSGHRPMAYMPVVQQFHLQDEYKGKDAFLLDFHFNAQISRARLFVKFEHLLNIITGQPPVYDIPLYPLPEGMFRFGISWMFFN